MIFDNAKLGLESQISETWFKRLSAFIGYMNEATIYIKIKIESCSTYFTSTQNSLEYIIEKCNKGK